MTSSTQDAGNIVADGPAGSRLIAIPERLRHVLSGRAMRNESRIILTGLLVGLALFALYLLADCVLPYQSSQGARLHSRLLEELRASNWVLPSATVYDHYLDGADEATTAEEPGRAPDAD